VHACGYYIWSGVTRLKTYDTDILCNQNYCVCVNYPYYMTLSLRPNIDAF
jgi:hypothetical protein